LDERLMGPKGISSIMSVLLLFLLVGCSSNQPHAPSNAQIIPFQSQNLPEYRIRPGDELEVKFFYNPEVNGKATVRPDGMIRLQLIDEVEAAGLTPVQLDKLLTKKYAPVVKQPVLTVIVRAFAGQKVYVGGEVNRRGPLDFTAGMTALDAVITAGGFKETAKPEEAIVIRKGPTNRPFPIRVNLQKALDRSNTVGAPQLLPFDIVYIPKSAIAKANQFVDQYIRRLLMFQGFGLTFSFSAGDLRRNFEAEEAASTEEFDDEETP